MSQMVWNTYLKKTEEYNMTTGKYTKVYLNQNIHLSEFLFNF